MEGGEGERARERGFVREEPRSRRSPRLAARMIPLLLCWSLALLHAPVQPAAAARGKPVLMLQNPLRRVFRGAAQAVGQPMRNGEDEQFQWLFRGRLWFRPALRPTPPAGALPDGVVALGLFGWTVGGVVALQYDESPVGPYLEYVAMGALVSKRGALGQWGARLYVSSAAAERACVDVWGVPASEARIQFDEEGDWLRVDLPPTPGKVPEIRLSGWTKTRTSAPDDPIRGGLPILWTPTLKALWAPIVPFPAGQTPGLNLHDLRLSAKSLSLHWCFQRPSDSLGIPLPVGLSVDGIVIEISERRDTDL